MFKSKRLENIIRQIIDERLIIETIITFNVNRNILFNRIKNKKLSVNEFDKKCRLLNKAEKSIFL